MRRQIWLARQEEHPWQDLSVKPIIYGPEEGEMISLGPTRTRFLAQQSDTEQLSVTDSVLAPGFPGPVPHRHEHTFDVFFVVEGTVTFRLEGETRELPAGSFVLVPPGNVHTFANPSDKPARLLNIMAPAGLEQYLKEVAAAAAKSGRPPDPREMAGIAARYDFQPA